MRAILLLAAVFLAVLAGDAQAATVSVVRLGTGNAVGVPATTWTVLYQAAPGETNSPTVYGAMTGVQSWIVRDTTAKLTAGAGCAPSRAGLVCSAPTTGGLAYLARAILNLGDRSDHGTTVGVDAIINGGAGDDVLRASGYPVVFDGGSGADSMSGPAGSTATYASRSNPVTVTLDGQANDGESGEDDNVTGATSVVIGGSGDDSLTAGRATATLEGGAGNDTLVEPGPGVLDGGSGNDVIHGGNGINLIDGGPGADLMTGGPGEDAVSYRSRVIGVGVTLDGRSNDGQFGEGDNVGTDIEDILGGLGNDTLVGSAARNVLAGGGGNNTMLGGAGNDVLYSEAGNDVMDGGPGSDRFVGASPGDTVRSHDGTVDLIECYQAGAPVLASDANDFAKSCAPRPMVPDGVVIRLSRSLRLALPVACPAGLLPCAGTVSVAFDDDPGMLGHGKYNLAPGAATTVVIALNGHLLAPLRGFDAFVIATMKTKRSAPRSTNVIESALNVVVPRH